MGITVLVTDGNLVPVGDPISTWTSLVATPTFVAAGPGTMTVPYTPSIWEQLTVDRARLVIIIDGDYFMGGQIEQDGFHWDASPTSGGSGDASEPGELTVSFTDDFIWIANEVSYPDPAHASTAQTTDFYTATATNAETVMRALVNVNVGPGALTARQVPKLILGGVAGVGSNINLSTRFEYLGDVLRRVAIAAGGLGFRTVQSAANIVFTVYMPSDLTAQIRYSRGLGNLQKISYAPAAPTCNVAIVGGDGTGTSRTIRERTDPASITRWGRIVKFVNQGDTSDTTVMDQAGDQALSDGAEAATVAFTAIDSDTQRYGHDYGLGDLVAVEVIPGLDVQAAVVSVTLTADPDTGYVISPQIGADQPITNSKILDALRALEPRVGYLERS